MYFHDYHMDVPSEQILQNKFGCIRVPVPLPCYSDAIAVANKFPTKSSGDFP